MMGLVRFFARIGLRWLVVGAFSRYVAKRFGRASVERAGRELEDRAHERLPAPVANVVSNLPPDVLNVGGSAVVAGRAVRSAANTTRRAGQLASGGTQRMAAGFGATRSVIDQVRGERDASATRLRARYLEATIGRGAATDALLDRRNRGPQAMGSDGSSTDAPSPHEAVPEPIERGRKRFRRRTTSPVNRMKRSYRPEPRAWDS